MSRPQQRPCLQKKHHEAWELNRSVGGGFGRGLQRKREGTKSLHVGATVTIPLVLLGVALFVVSLGFGIFTPILPQYAAKLGIDAASLGFAYSLYNVALVIFLFPGGIMADRFGRVKTIVSGMVLFAVSSLMLVFAEDLYLFAIARVVEGVGSALTTPAIFALTADLAPQRARGSGMGFTSTMENVGSLAGPTVGGLLAQVAGFASPFYVACAMALVSAGLVLPIRDQTDRHLPSSRSSPITIFSSLRQNVSASRSLLVLCVRGFIIGISQSLFVLVFVLYMAFNIDMQPAEVGFSFTLISGSMLAFTFLAGNLSDRFGRKPFVILGGIIIGSMIIAFSLTRSIAEVYLVSIILGLGVAVNNAPINALLADCVIAEIRAKVMGGYEVIVGLGRTVGVLFLGGLYAISPSAPFNLLGALLFVTVGLVAVFVVEPRDKTVDPSGKRQ